MIFWKVCNLLQFENRGNLDCMRPMCKSNILFSLRICLDYALLQMKKYFKGFGGGLEVRLDHLKIFLLFGKFLLVDFP